MFIEDLEGTLRHWLEHHFQVSNGRLLCRTALSNEHAEAAGRDKFMNRGSGGTSLLGLGRIRGLYFESMSSQLEYRDDRIVCLEPGP